MDSRVAWSKDVVWRRIDDEVVVVKHDGRTLCTLNKMATCIWEMCSGEYEDCRISAAICQRFEIGEQEALADVRETLRKFRQLGLVEEVTKSGV